MFTLFLCLLFCMVCILYGLGQITSLQLTNYWCDKKDLSTIYSHSIEYGLNEGTNDGCWKSKQFTVDLNSLFDSTTSYSAVNDINAWSVSRCIMWLLFSILYLIPLIFVIAVLYEFKNIYHEYVTSPPKNPSVMDLEIELQDIARQDRKESVSQTPSHASSPTHAQASSKSSGCFGKGPFIFICLLLLLFFFLKSQTNKTPK